jgi:hypothetical protein
MSAISARYCAIVVTSAAASSDLLAAATMDRLAVSTASTATEFPGGTGCPIVGKRTGPLLPSRSGLGIGTVPIPDSTISHHASRADR